jgi:hypothetical protein
MSSGEGWLSVSDIASTFSEDTTFCGMVLRAISRKLLEALVMFFGGDGGQVNFCHFIFCRNILL